MKYTFSLFLKISQKVTVFCYHGMSVRPYVLSRHHQQTVVTMSTSDDNLLSSLPGGMVSLHSPSEGQDWQPILHSSNQVVLYNPKSHALSISRFSSSHDLTVRNNACPYCRRALPEGFEHFTEDSDFDVVDPMHHTRKPDYFHLLAAANENTSVPPSLTAHEDNGPADSQSGGTSRAFPPNTLAEGYFKRFFQEDYKLGMGANGSVYLCQVSPIN